MSNQSNSFGSEHRKNGLTINPTCIPEDLIMRKTAAGRGQGCGALYNPWLHAGEVSSRGRAHRILGWRHRRIHHLLSNYERDCYFIFCWDERVLDIRERFPLLPIQKTLEIALQFGIKPPMNPATGQYMVMTSDFRLTIKRGDTNVDIIRTFVPKQELEARRVKDKFRIEQTFWEAAGVEWGILTEESYSRHKAENIKRIYWHFDSLEFAQRHRLSDTKRHAIITILTPLVGRGDTPLNEACLACDTQLGLLFGTSLAVAYHCIATRLWSVNMEVLIDPDRPLLFVPSDLPR